MKTYILSTLDSIRQYSKTLDAKAILYNKNWEVFNDSGEKEVLIFRPKNELLIVRQGIVQRSKWELLPMGALLIETDTTTCLFNAAFVDNNFLAMQLDGTDECMLMVESNCMKQMILDSISKIENYLKDTYIGGEANNDLNTKFVSGRERYNRLTEKDNDTLNTVIGTLFMSILFLLIIVYAIHFIIYLK